MASPIRNAKARLIGRERAAIERLLTQAERPTAIFASDSIVAYDIFKTTRMLGLRVPDDLSLIAFYDAEWTSVTTPPISVIDQPVYDMGAKVAELLIARINGEHRRRGCACCRPASSSGRRWPRPPRRWRRPTAPPGAAGKDGRGIVAGMGGLSRARDGGSRRRRSSRRCCGGAAGGEIQRRLDRSSGQYAGEIAGQEGIHRPRGCRRRWPV